MKTPKENTTPDTFRNVMYIKQSNDLSAARYSWTLVQKKLLYIIFYHIQNLQSSIDKNANMKLTFPDKYLTDIDGNITRIYSQLADMRKKDMKVNTNRKWLCVGIVNYVEHNKINGTIEIEISHKILPYLLELTNQFTSYNFLVAMNFNSVYSQRFYELCCQYKTLGFFSFEIEELKKMFGIVGLYERYTDFCKKIMEVAHSELFEKFNSNACDVCFDWSVDAASKIGKKITRLNFSVVSKNLKYTKKQMELADYMWQICDDWAMRYLGRHRRELLRQYLFTYQDKCPEIYAKFQRIISSYKHQSDITKVLTKALKEDYQL